MTDWTQWCQELLNADPLCAVMWFAYSPAISKRLEKRMIDFVVLLRSDQIPKSGPVSSPLRLKAARPSPRKYGGASKIWRYLHIVGRMTAETPREGWRRMSEEEKGGRCVNNKPCLPVATYICCIRCRIHWDVSLQPKCQTDSALMRSLSHVFKPIKLS